MPFAFGDTVTTHPLRRAGTNSDLVQARIILLKLEHYCSLLPRTNPGCGPHKKPEKVS